MHMKSLGGHVERVGEADGHIGLVGGEPEAITNSELLVDGEPVVVAPAAVVEVGM